MDTPEFPPKAQRWQISVWYGAGLGLLLTIAVLLTFTGVSIWRTTTLVAERTTADLSFTFASIGTINLTLLRLIAVLIGAAICFSGLAVSFFAHEKAMTLELGHEVLNAGSAKGTLATYSPGLVGMLVGMVIVVCALFSKSEHTYQGPKTTTLEVTAVDEAPPAAPVASKASTMRTAEQVLQDAASASK